MPPVYEVCIVKRPSDNDLKAGAAEAILMPPKAVAAPDDITAIAIAVSDSKVQMDASIKVLVRPFYPSK